jgi:hypothetical protein
MSKHTNNGSCPKCKEIMDVYPNMNQQLRQWFVGFQKATPEVHLSCAGRGYADQMAAFEKGYSKAKFGESAHNWNCAVDIFVLLPGKDIYDSKWFQDKIAGKLPYFLKWYGEPGAVFFELPHIEIREWRGLKVQNLAGLVEEPPKDIA